MTTVPPPSTPPPQMPVASPAAATAVAVLQPPPKIAALPPGTVLEAVVVPAPPSTDAAGKPTVTLRTADGDINLRLPVQLPDNARVSLEVLRNAAVPNAAQTATQTASQVPAQITVRLLSVDGQPAAQVLAQLTRQAIDTRGVATQLPLPGPQNPALDAQNPLLRVAVLVPGAAWTAAGSLQVTSLGTFSALVTQGSPVAQPAPDEVVATPALPSTPPVITPPATPVFLPPTGTELSLRVTSVELPATPSPAIPTVPNTVALIPSAPGAPLATSVPVAMPVSVATHPDVPATPPATVPTTVVAQPVTPQPGLILPGPLGLGASPPQPPVTVQTPPVLATVTGTVIGVSSTGAPVIDTTAGQMQLNVRANLPVGTQVTLEITARLAPPPDFMPAPPTPASALPLSSPAGTPVSWPTLTESLAVLQRTDPQAALQLAQTIPDGGPRTTVALMSFVQAMRTGDARQWPGDTNLRALEAASPRGAHLASQLSDEVSALLSRARDTGTEWRALPVPWNADGQIDRIALITRREGESDETDNKRAGGGGTRFLINLDLSRLGSLQLDGMFRKETRGFDLMVRTKTALPENMRHDLTGIFAASNAAMGLKGGLTFQVVKKFADPVGQAAGDKGGLWA